MPVIMLSGSRFNMLDVSGLTAWYDASKIVGLNDGDTVTSWTDESANSYNLSIYGGGTPKYKTNIMNSQPTVLYDGVDDGHTYTNVSNALISASDGTVMIAARTPGAINASTPWYLIEFGVTGVAGLVTSTPANTIVGQNYDAGGVDVTGTKSIAINTNYSWTWLHTGGTLYLGSNDTRTSSMASIASANTVIPAGTDLGVGVGSGYWSGYVAEVAFFNVALSEATRQEIENYFASKWGITLPY